MIDIATMTDLNNELVEIMAEQMQIEIDREIMEKLQSEMLLADGWTKVPITWAQDFLKSMWSAETAEWCHKNATGDYKLLNGNWYFEKATDATAFTLKWA